MKNYKNDQNNQYYNDRFIPDRKSSKFHLANTSDYEVNQENNLVKLYQKEILGMKINDENDDENKEKNRILCFSS